VTAQQALEQSLNAASVRIGLACGIDPILKTARTLGIQTKLDEDNPSILLGAAGFRRSMAEAYATIARQGARMPPRAIRYVTDDRGRMLRGAGTPEPVQVFPQRDVYLLTHVMQGVIDRGTAEARGASASARPRREDRHDERQARRLVHRLHAEDARADVGRLR
jgi:membrane peptidoglycan carboxypeptidase